MKNIWTFQRGIFHSTHYSTGAVQSEAYVLVLMDTIKPYKLVNWRSKNLLKPHILQTNWQFQSMNTKKYCFIPHISFYTLSLNRPLGRRFILLVVMSVFDSVDMSVLVHEWIFTSSKYLNIFSFCLSFSYKA